MAEQNAVVIRHNALNAEFEKRLKNENRRFDAKNENDKRINRSPEKNEGHMKKYVKGE